MFFRGGVRIGTSHWNSLNYTWPFAGVSFGNDGFRIATSFLKRKEYVILYKNVTNISYKRSLFCKGVIIEHDMPTVPLHIIFWTRQADIFLQLCKKHSLPITRK